MKVLICDDEPLALRRLRRLLADTDYVVCGEAVNGEQALEQTEKLQPDIVLLDIKMPGMDGIQAARALGAHSRPPAIVFTTAYDEFALAAIQASASAYLMKPIDRSELLQALSRSVVSNQAQLARLNSISTTAEPAALATEFLTVQSARGSQRIELADILYARADSKYVVLRHLGGEALSDLSLRQLEDQYATHLIRIHRNSLINPAYLRAVRRVDDRQFIAVLRYLDEQLPISRRLVPQIRNYLQTGNQ